MALDTWFGDWVGRVCLKEILRKHVGRMCFSRQLVLKVYLRDVFRVRPVLRTRGRGRAWWACVVGERGGARGGRAGRWV